MMNRKAAFVFGALLVRGGIHMMNRKAAFVFGALLAVSTAVWAAGGFPSRPRFQSVGVGSTAPSGTGNINATGGITATGDIGANNINASGTFTAVSVGINQAAPTGDTKLDILGTGGIARFRTTAARGTGNAYVQFFDPTGSKGFVGYGAVSDTLHLWNEMNATIEIGTNNTLAAYVTTAQVFNFINTPTVSSVPIPLATSGTFTASFDIGCSTTPTITYDYVKTGSLVTVIEASQIGFNCTGDHTDMRTTGVPIPAALRPTAPQFFAKLLKPGAVTDDGVLKPACTYFGTDGNIKMPLRAATTGDCDATTWTASGVRAAFNNGATYSWHVLNP